MATFLFPETLTSGKKAILVNRLTTVCQTEKHSSGGGIWLRCQGYETACLHLKEADRRECWHSSDFLFSSFTAWAVAIHTHRHVQRCASQWFSKHSQVNNEVPRTGKVFLGQSHKHTEAAATVFQVGAGYNLKSKIGVELLQAREHVTL